VNKSQFRALDSGVSVTSKIELVSDLSWFDNVGKLTVIDCPGLSDSKGGD